MVRTVRPKTRLGRGPALPGVKHDVPGQTIADRTPKMWSCWSKPIFEKYSFPSNPILALFRLSFDTQ